MQFLLYNFKRGNLSFARYNLSIVNRAKCPNLLWFFWFSSFLVKRQRRAKTSAFGDGFIFRASSALFLPNCKRTNWFHWCRLSSRGCTLNRYLLGDAGLNLFPKFIVVVDIFPASNRTSRAHDPQVYTNSFCVLSLFTWANFHSLQLSQRQRRQHGRHVENTFQYRKLSDKISKRCSLSMLRIRGVSIRSITLVRESKSESFTVYVPISIIILSQDAFWHFRARPWVYFSLCQACSNKRSTNYNRGIQSIQPPAYKCRHPTECRHCQSLHCFTWLC